MKQEKPAYLQLYEALRDEIIQGLWPYGARLPSRRQAARDRQVSVVTVEHSYELLCQEGYAEARPKSGYFVCFRASDGFAAAEAQPLPRPQGRFLPDEENAFPFSVLARTMRRVLSEYGEGILNKSPNAGCGELRSAISRYLARNRGIRVEKEQIIIGSGAEYLYGMVVEMLGSGRVFAIESPSYEKIGPRAFPAICFLWGMTASKPPPWPAPPPVCCISRPTAAFPAGSRPAPPSAGNTCAGPRKGIGTS